MFARKHLDYQASYTPDVGFEGVGALFDYFRSHPENGALQRRSMHPIAGEEI